jgi:MFS family permease
MKNNYLTLLTLFRILRSISAGMIMIIFPYYVLKFLNYGSLILGFIYTAASIATALLGLASGILADQWGKKEALLLIAALLPISTLILYFSNNLVLIFIASMLGGFSATGSLAGGGVGGAAQPIQTSIIAELTEVKERTFWISFLTFISGIASAFGSLLAREFNILDGFLFATFISLTSIVFIIPIKTSRAQKNDLKHTKIIGKFTLTGMLNGLSQGLITPFLIPFFIIVYNIPKADMATFSFISGIIGSASLLFAPKIEKKWGFVKGIAYTRGLGAALSIIMPIIRIFPLSIAIYLSMPALRVAALPVQQAAMTEMVDQGEVGRALGINQVARLASSSAGTTISGYMFDISEIELPFFVYSFITFFNILLYFKFFKDEKVQIKS